jgi:hypothetical protein
MNRSFAAALSLLIANSAYAADSLCLKSEAVYFSCAAGKKLVSLCGSNQINESEGYITYRYGSKAHLELEYPNKITHPKRLFSVEYQLWAHDERTDINFKNGAYYYSIYSQFIGGLFDPNVTNSGYGESAGVIVSRKGKEIADIRCTGEVTIAIEPLKFLSNNQE